MTGTDGARQTPLTMMGLLSFRHGLRPFGSVDLALIPTLMGLSNENNPCSYTLLGYMDIIEGVTNLAE